MNDISITRNGVEIPLTTDEIDKIYRYRRRKYNIEDVEIVLDDLAEDGSLYNEYELAVARKHIAEAAAKYENIRNNSEDWVYTARSAIKFVIEEYRDE